jgi:hypothetical protein
MHVAAVVIIIVIFLILVNVRISLRPKQMQVNAKNILAQCFLIDMVPGEKETLNEKRTDQHGRGHLYCD